jgi:hypothetical protein
MQSASARRRKVWRGPALSQVEGCPRPRPLNLILGDREKFSRNLRVPGPVSSTLCNLEATENHKVLV